MIQFICGVLFDCYTIKRIDNSKLISHFECHKIFNCHGTHIYKYNQAWITQVYSKWNGQFPFSIPIEVYIYTGCYMCIDYFFCIEMTSFAIYRRFVYWGFRSVIFCSNCLLHMLWPIHIHFTVINSHLFSTLTRIDSCSHYRPIYRRHFSKPLILLIIINVIPKSTKLNK